jgi:high-affinity Fe2+/Pb2+ permease
VKNMPDLTQLGEYLSAQIAVIILILLGINVVRAYSRQAWGQFFTSLIMAILCYVVVKFPGEFESLAKNVWDGIKSGGLS